ncbi:MAG TPA: c-type cytochrome domain-containing protein, partial [Humisphaera sp.]
MPRTVARLLLLPLAGLITGAAAAPPPQSAPPAAAAAALGTEFDQTIRPLLQKHCYECHGPDKQEGGVSFADLKPGIAALRSRALWRRSGSQVRSGDMPPDDAKHPLPPAEKAAFVAWAKSAVDAMAVDPRNPDPGPALARRLNRTEYDN